MSQLVFVRQSGLQLVFEWGREHPVRLLHLSAKPFSEKEISSHRDAYPLVQVQTAGGDQNDHHARKHTGTWPGSALRYVSHSLRPDSDGASLQIVQQGGGVRTVTTMRFFSGVPLVRCETDVENIGSEEISLEYVSSFCLTGLESGGPSSWAEKMVCHIPHNTWQGEAQWVASTLPQLGLSPVFLNSVTRVQYGVVGTWSCAEYAPMGILENTEDKTCCVWQVENNGTWGCEISDTADSRLYLQVYGPDRTDGQWSKLLRPGEHFSSVPAAFGSVRGDWQEAIAAITAYRRKIHFPTPADSTLPVYFNDYLHCLNADPDIHKVAPLIRFAADIGCEGYCMDAGWYADGTWWDCVGEWVPNPKRFPQGIETVSELCREKGLLPGIWLEPEVMGVHCPLAETLPDSWFFCRAGKRVVDHGRYQLDFRNPAVVEYLSAVVDRLVTQYGFSYIKMDYNIDPASGTECRADSAGDGLLGHTRALLCWIDTLRRRYPGLILESCASGAMRMDGATLQRFALQSVTDQVDYRLMPYVVAAFPTVVPPEQALSWACPLENASDEEVIMNMVNVLLLRPLLSGDALRQTESGVRLISEAVALYKTYRASLPSALPFWPIGLPAYGKQQLALGLRFGDCVRVAVWNLSAESRNIALPLPGLMQTAACVYPAAHPCPVSLSAEGSVAVVSLPPLSARLIQCS